jgi:hypothetical protein
MSLLSALTGGQGYENLGGGYKQSTSNITSIPSRDGSVRQPLSVPNGAVPGVTGALRNSTARPGKMTNQRIVYTRVQTQFPKDCAHVDRVPVMEGDVVFVHRMDGMNTAGTPLGNDTARTSRIASIMQMNTMLKGGNANTTGELTMAADKNPRGEPTSPDSQNPVWERWANCKVLARWTPDGVLASKEHDCVMDASNPGEAFNVTVGGPTLTRNHATGDYPQHFDDGVRVLDRLFVGLIATEHREGVDGAGPVEYFSFQYKLFTSRQLAWAPLGMQNVQLHDMERSAPGGDNRLGPTVAEFARMVQVWRIGSIFDNKSGMMPYRCAMVNVVVEEWSLDQVRAEYNEYFGESLALAVLPDAFAEVPAVLQAAYAYATTNDGLLQTTKELISELYNNNLASEVRQWEDADAAWRDNMELAPLRGKTRAEYSPPTVSVTYVSQHGMTLGGSVFYNTPSPEMSAFWEAYGGNDSCRACARLFVDEAAMAPVGRATALLGNKKLLKVLSGAQRGQLEAINRAHAIITGLRAPMRLGRRIAKGIREIETEGGRWPVA